MPGEPEHAGEHEPELLLGDREADPPADEHAGDRAEQEPAEDPEVDVPGGPVRGARRRTGARPRGRCPCPTTLCARSGKMTSSVSPKNTPLPTDVRPTMKPPNAPMRIAATQSRRLKRTGMSPVVAGRIRLFATSPAAPKSSAAPSTWPITDSTSSP